MRLIHYSKKPIKRMRRMLVEQKDMRGSGVFQKPRGLWVSVEGEYGWPEWCMDEKFRMTDYVYATEIDVSASNILHLSTADEIRAFHDLFSERLDYGAALKDYVMERIAWEKVAESYDGIIISPYCWEMRMDTRAQWYYTWDCASGCIWRSHGVKKNFLGPVDWTKMKKEKEEAA